MKKLATYVVVAAAALIGTPAFAADMAVKAPPPAPPPVCIWCGFYIGANGGFGWNDSRSASITPGDPATAFVTKSGHQNVDPASASFDTNGGLGGIQIGYNWQFDPHWVVAGIEADIDGADIRGSGVGPVNMSGFGPDFAALTASQKVDWFGTVRARVGFLPMSNVLLYVTGGLAYGNVKESANVAVNPGGQIGFGISGFGFACQTISPPTPGFGGPLCFSGSQSRTSAGWTAGGGFEILATSNISVRLEYLYVNLGSQTFNIPAAFVFGGEPNPSFLHTHFNDAAFNVVRVGLNYKFGGPVVAGY